MKLICALFLLLVSLPVHAEIFVCKDDKNKTIYQDTQCSNITIRKFDTLPSPSLEEQTQAQERVQKMTEASQQRAAVAELERQQQEKNNIELEKIAIERRRLELLEQQAAVEQTAPRAVFVQPWYRKFQRQHHHRGEHNSNNTNRPNARNDKELPINTNH